MEELQKMHISEIVDMTNLYLTPRSMFKIWKDNIETSNTSENGYQMLQKNPKLAEELAKNEVQLYTFLVRNERYIDKFKFAMTLLINYRERLEISKEIQLSAEEKDLIQKGLAGLKKLLKGIDRTAVYYNMSDDGNRILHLTVLNTKEMLEGKERKDRNSNRKRLEEIKADINFANITQSIFRTDIEYTIPFDQSIGADIRHMVEFNTVMREYNGRVEEIDMNIPIHKLANNIDRTKFVKEIAEDLEKHIEEINLDKLLLCSAYRYIEGIERGWIRKDAIQELRRRLLEIKAHIGRSAKIVIYPDISYTLKDFEKDLERFIEKDEKVEYLSKEEIEQLRTALFSGETTLNNLERQTALAIGLNSASLSEILSRNTDNYIFFLQGEKCPYSKNVILRDILKSNKCSTDLLQMLCEKTDITPQEICDLYDKEIISAGDLKAVRELTGTIITDDTLFEKYKKYKENGEQEEKTELERYALAYRNTEILGKNPEEVQSKAEEFIAGVGEELEPSDLIELYGLNIIPLKVAVDWGGEDIIEELLQSGRLKPVDARYLRDEGLLNEEVLERLFKKCKQMVYSDQVSLVSAVFDGQTPEEKEIRERLAQYYNIESGISSFKEKVDTEKRKVSSREQKSEEPKRKIRMRDPGAKYNFLTSIDKDVSVEAGIIDGHIIFHYPNIDGGTVLIEKLHKIKTNTQNGLIEIKADNKSATYVLSEEEFIKMKSDLIQGGKVDRTQLTQKWWVIRDSEHWIPHNGVEFWERAIMERFEINEDNSRYSLDDLKKIQELKEKSIESKKMEDR